MIFFLMVKVIGNPNNLILIAHPDDETMFFTPILQNLKGKTHILCLSTGDHEGKGFIRKKEIFIVSNLYKFDLFVLNLFDDNKDWNSDHIKSIIEFFNLIYNYDVIYTFDKHGVSGHKNHISCYEAMKKLIPYIKAKVYFLESKNLFRKYVYDYGFSNGLLYKVNDFLKGIKMMLIYSSQLTWYRYLFMIFSTYFRNVYVVDQ